MSREDTVIELIRKLNIQIDLPRLPIKVALYEERVDLLDRQEADDWLSRWDWEAAAKIIKCITVGHDGKQLRVWVDWWTSFNSYQVHFDTSEGKLFDVNSTDKDVIQYVLDGIKEYSGRREWVTFRAELPIQVILSS